MKISALVLAALVALATGATGQSPKPDLFVVFNCQEVETCDKNSNCATRTSRATVAVHKDFNKGLQKTHYLAYSFAPSAASGTLYAAQNFHAEAISGNFVALIDRVMDTQSFVWFWDAETLPRSLYYVHPKHWGTETGPLVVTHFSCEQVLF